MGGLSIALAASYTVDATDTIAGYSAGLTASTGKPGAFVTFHIQKPRGEIIEIHEQADQSGIAITDFVGFHTNLAGDYKVSAYTDGELWQNAPQTVFRVYPDTVSPVNSDITAVRDSAAADGKEPAKVVIKLADRNGNPIINHLVTLISSRLDDEIEAINGGYSDRFGEAAFFVRSRADGVSYLSAYDKNSGVTLNARAKLVFFKATQNSFFGGNLNVYMANSFLGDDGEVVDNTFDKIDHFVVTIAKTVQVGKGTDMTVTAVDKNEKTVRDYHGQIIIQSTDRFATLPNNGGTYTFSDADEGEKKFDKGLIFSETGSHTITVYDFDGVTVSPNIKGEAEIKVTDEVIAPTPSPTDTPGIAAPPSPPPPPDTQLEIKKPEDGSKFGGSSVITITGTGQANTDLKIFLDDTKVVDGNEQDVIIPVDADGFFSYELKGVADGNHKVYVQMVESPDQNSATVNFLVDATAPEFKDISIFPTGTLQKGQAFTITIFSEPDLASATVRIGSTGTVSNLNAASDQPDKYTLTMKAPDAPGDFLLNIELKDQLENITKINQTSVTVMSDMLLGAPLGVQALPGNGTVSITWLPLGKTDISGYKVYSGTNDLITDTVVAQVAGTESMAFISGLQNGQIYYFAVSAIGTGGSEGTKSQIVSAQPFDPSTPLMSPSPFISATPGLKRIIAVPSDGSVELQWESPTAPAAYFDVRFGISPGVYSERFAVSGFLLSTTVSDLINALPYYFTIVPLNANGIPTGEQYVEVQMAPGYSGVHPAPQYPPIITDQTMIPVNPGSGIESIFLFFLSFSFAAAMFFIHRAIRYSNL